MDPAHRPTGRSLGRPGDSCSVDIRVRYAEVDAMGYLHHSRYWVYFEEVRTELLRQHGFRYRDLEAEGVFFVVYTARIKFLVPIRYDDLVTVTARVVRMTRTRVDHAYEIQREGVKACDAETTLACVGRDGQPVLMPESLWSSPGSDRTNG